RRHSSWCSAGCITTASTIRSPVAASARPGSRRPRGVSRGGRGRLVRVAQQVLVWERAPARSHIDITLLSPAGMRRLYRLAARRRGGTGVIAYSLPPPHRSPLGDR